ncbi:MAG: ribose-5-phosphate isomerase RpiA [Deltaproteobacteria bacterium]|nr:ribose-5-phosphate isomerase RpiA [Deltaproteobacteria bacterium]
MPPCPPPPSTTEDCKRRAAEAAVAYVENGMVVGLGTGSTATYATAKLGALWQDGALSALVCIPTSEKTAAQARALGLPLGELASHPRLDLAIDGADEVDLRLNLIKGMGGALVREKAVERAARRFVVIVDPSKRSAKLGTLSPLPVEVLPEARPRLALTLRTLGAQVTLRGGDRPFVSDNGNPILDCRFDGGIDDPAALAHRLDREVGVVGHGLFLGMATEVLVGHPDRIEILRPAPA